MQPILCYCCLKDPKPHPCTPCPVFSIPGHAGGQKLFASTPFPTGAVLLKSRQGQTLRAFPVLERKTLKGMSLGARGAHLEKKKKKKSPSFYAEEKRHLQMGPDLVLHLIPGHGEGSTGWVVREASAGQACTEPGPIPLPGAAAGCAPAEDSWLVLAGAEETKWLILLLPSSLPWSLVPVLQRRGRE